MLGFKELLIFYLSENNYLFEIIEELGIQKTLRFISIFGGQKIDIPSRGDVRKRVIDFLVFLTLDKNTTNEEEIERLKQRFGFTKRQLQGIHLRVSREFKESNMQEMVKQYKSSDKMEYTREEMNKFVTELL